MSSRHRQSAGRPEGSSRTPLSVRSIPALPQYKKPSYPLDGRAQEQLRHIYAGQQAKVLEVQNTKAITAIQDASVAIIDHLLTREKAVERKRKRWEKRGVGEDDPERKRVDEELKKLKEAVEQKTQELEKAMRGAVDEEMAQQRIKDSLNWLKEIATRQMEAEYETQRNQRTQSSQRRRNTASSQDDEDAGPTPGPTPLNGPRIELTGLSALFTERIESAKDQYLLHSHKTRYAQNNHYTGWRRVVHDAKYGDTIPVPHADTWFDDHGRPSLGVTATQDEEDDDLVIAQATISTKCPLTLQQFKVPFTSKKCPHSFEKDDVLTIIRRNPHKAIQCPVPGCDQVRIYSKLLPLIYDAWVDVPSKEQ